MNTEIALVSAGSGLAAAAIVIAGFWIALGTRLANSEKDATHALQTSAENENELRELYNRMNRDVRESGEVNQRLASIEQAILAMQGDLKQLTKVLVELGSVRGELKSHEQRMGRIDQDIRDLRRGRGFIQEEIKGEYPR